MNNTELIQHTTEYINFLEDYKKQIDKQSKSVNLIDAKSMWILSTKIDVMVQSLEDFLKYV